MPHLRSLSKLSAKTFLALVVLLVGTRMALPYVLKSQINRILKDRSWVA
jgi:hypothetical protein